MHGSRQMDFNDEAAIVEAVLFLEAEPIDEAGIAKISGLEKSVVVKALKVLV